MVKPHGKTYRVRRRCPVCGYIVNDPRRFTWDQKFQTFMVQFGGYKRISYEEVPDEDYVPMMQEVLIRLGPRLGLTVKRKAGGRRAEAEG